jgi:hypothetical protein
MGNNNWADFPNGMIADLRLEDAILVQDVSDTTESDEGTTKGALIGQLAELLGGGGGGGQTGGVPGGYSYVQSESLYGEPINPTVGETWFDPDVGRTYLRYDDGTSILWIQTAGGGIPGETGPAGPQGAPGLPPEGSYVSVLYDTGIAAWPARAAAGFRTWWVSDTAGVPAPTDLEPGDLVSIPQASP